jgi:hypothetical protein
MAHECEYCGQQCACDLDDTGALRQPDDCLHLTTKDGCDYFDDDDWIEDTDNDHTIYAGRGGPEATPANYVPLAPSTWNLPMICSRCNGFAIRHHDRFGAAVSCMICGHEQHDTPADTTPPDQLPDGRHQRPRKISYATHSSSLRQQAAARLERIAQRQLARHERRFQWARTYADRRSAGAERNP